MSNILQAEVSIKGVRPLIWHAFGPEALPLEKQEKTGVAGNDPSEWARTVLMTSDRSLYVRSSYVFGSVRDGARHTKRGKGSIQSYVACTLQIGQEVLFVKRDGDILKCPEAPIDDPTLSVYLDICGVRNPSTKARNVRYRIAASAGWEIDFTTIWDKTIVSRGEMEAVVIDAGRLCGLGDGRSIGNGRFDVIRFEVSEVSIKKAA